MRYQGVPYYIEKTKGGHRVMLGGREIGWCAGAKRGAIELAEEMIRDILAHEKEARHEDE